VAVKALHDSEIEVERLSLGEVSTEILGQLERLYADAYRGSRMYRSLLEDVEEGPGIFKLFLARRIGYPDEVAGARVIELKPHSFIEYRGYEPLHGKRFCVSPPLRGFGIGRALIAEGSRYSFQELEARAIFGESNEIGALALAGREGALFLVESIENRSARNFPRENADFFREFIINPKFRSYRFPVGDGVQFAYCRDAEIAADFRAHGHRSMRELLGVNPEKQP